MYVDKHQFHVDLTEWSLRRIAAVAAGLEPPEITPYVSHSIINICRGLGRRANFNGYPFIEEMIGDGILDCFRAVKNYKPDNEKQNPYGYFTKVAWSAFLRRLELEARQGKVIRDLMFDENNVPYTIIDGDGAVLDKNEFRQTFINFGE